jgi:stage III sporulation protein AC
MDVGLILKIAGIGLIVSVLCQVLSKNGREDQASLVSLAGVIIVLFMLVSKLSELIKVIEGVFGIV